MPKVLANAVAISRGGRNAALNGLIEFAKSFSVVVGCAQKKMPVLDVLPQHGHRMKGRRLYNFILPRQPAFALSDTAVLLLGAIVF